MVASVWQTPINVGDLVEEGQVLVVLEAMKTEFGESTAQGWD